MQAIVLQVNTKGALNGLSDGTCNSLHRCRANLLILTVCRLRSYDAINCGQSNATDTMKSSSCQHSSLNED